MPQLIFPAEGVHSNTAAAYKMKSFVYTRMCKGPIIQSANAGFRPGMV